VAHKDAATIKAPDSLAEYGIPVQTFRLPVRRQRAGVNRSRR